MDLETENRIAAILLKEAAELRRQAQSEGALAYLRKPTVRSRPNSRFLTATVRGVQQANRAVEVNEMWRLREKQIELDNRIKARNRDGGCSFRDSSESLRSRHRDGNGEGISASTCSIPPKERKKLDTTGDEGLRDDEVDEFLHSRIKRGRGAVGSRMDETGPYLSSRPDSETNATGNSDGEVERPRPRVVLGPEKPYSLLSEESTSDEDEEEEESRKKAKTSSRKHKSSKEKKKKKSKEREKKHHHRHRHK